MALAVVLLVLAADPGVARAATLSLSGVVFYDRNDNGVRDPGEPGVPGLRIRHGSGRVVTTTGGDGGYSVSGLPAFGALVVETGWLRSQCPAAGRASAITCPRGPGRDNDFAVDNQFIGYPLTGASSATGVDVGLLPDWPGPGLLPPLSGGAVPANPVDVAARLSWTESECAGGGLHICRAGDTFRLAAQVYNQGTTPLSGIQAVLSVPAGDCLTGLQLVGAGTSPAVTGMTSSAYSCDSRTVNVALAGTLVPGGAALIAVDGRTVAGPGTPGCRIDAIDPGTCTVAEPQGRGWLFAVTHLDQPGDADSAFCNPVPATMCPTGVHDKRRSPDEVDPVGHNVDAALGGSTAYNLQGHLALAGGTVRRGAALTLRAWVSDSGAGAVNQAPPGATVVLYLPPGSRILSVPDRHILLDCITQPGPQVSCRYRGPLSPGLAAIAVDVTAVVPDTWPAGVPYRPVLCAIAPPAAVAETLPAAACGPGTVAAGTASDNDADLNLVVP
ncbi:hypothetical protein ODJ79_44750 [Actinoplanes sp. KI2]|uniref:hypothetical protein n=1 Tax=Actinoplanes sp. KI2 TaxID=2983315 RepID=UPI0021D5A1D1|nr:hypothetical protein [Actinoplanes sp. KI2]MCU7730868.1 hypothetical protein [Actinoplanes sp. KI2]